MPLTVIITAAKTVSRASPEVSLSVVTIRVTIRPTSMMVTATARTQRAEGFADAVRDDLGVVDGGEHRADQHDGDQDQHDRHPGGAPR